MANIAFSGLASGIDSTAIIDATIDAKRLSGLPLQNKLAQNEAEDKSYDELKLRLLALDEAVKGFQTFKGNQLSKVIKSSDEDHVSAVVSGGASNGTVTFSVVQLASTARVTFDGSYGAADQSVAPTLSGDGTLTIQIGTGPDSYTSEIIVNSSTKLSDLVESINASSDGKFGASLINVGSSANPQFRLMIAGTETGLEKGTLSITADSALQGAGALDTFQQVQATNSILDIPGVGTVTRNKNSISDIFPGVSFELKQASTVPVALTVSNDPSATSKRVAEFVSAYNELKVFIDTEDTITSQTDDKGVTNKYGSLAKSRVDDQVLSSLRNALLKVSGTGKDGKLILADLGVKTDRSTGNLEFDSDVFEAKLASDSDGVALVLSSLGDSISSTNGVVNSFTGFNGIISQAKSSNSTENKMMNERLQRLEANIEKQREYLQKLFSRLEDTVAGLQSGASALSSLSNNNNSKK